MYMCRMRRQNCVCPVSSTWLVDEHATPAYHFGTSAWSRCCVAAFRHGGIGNSPCHKPTMSLAIDGVAAEHRIVPKIKRPYHGPGFAL